MSKREELAAALQGIFKKKDVLADAPMSRYTTLRLGGPAELLCEVSTIEQLKGALSLAAQFETPVFLLGNGSNLLVKDGGLRGLVLHLADGFAEVGEPVPLPDGRVTRTAQAGATLVKLANAAADAGLCGLEFASGIPGTVGGGVCMNAGAYGGEMKDVVTGVTALTYAGEARHFTGEEMRFGYRTSRVQSGEEPLIVVSATVALEERDEETIRATMREFAARRREKQPLTEPCCGSTFKRPEGNFAGTLIEQCGLKGLHVGGASVSEKHAGFLVGGENCTAADYLALIARVQNAVLEKTGVKLEPEVRIVGEDAPATEI